MLTHYGMENDEPAIVTGDVENIVIKPEPLFDEEDETYWLGDTDDEEDVSDAEVLHVGFDGPAFVTSSGEIVAINDVEGCTNLVQTPFYLESYFRDGVAESGSPGDMDKQESVVKIDRITCYECNIVFCNEHRLLEHLMTHINVYRMGCNVCDKDLNLAEKFQLHMMAVTWQSVYYCDFCRKSCAGVVRSKSHPPPPNKTYMCHDCEYQTKVPYVTLRTTQHFEIHDCAPPPTTEVLQEQRPNGEVKLEEYFPAEDSSSNTDCYSSRKSPLPKKENVNLQTDSSYVTCSSPRATMNVRSTRCSKDKYKIVRVYKCHYCPTPFSEHWTLMRHLREKHNCHNLKVCKYCGKEFMQQRCYENHLNFHKLAKHYTCFVCNLAFLSKFELEQHAQMHDRSAGVNILFSGDSNAEVGANVDS